MLTTQPGLPLVDDEYNEHTAVYQSVLRAKQNEPYVVAEFGARWGTWGSRAAGFWRAKRPGRPYILHMIEANEANCEGLRIVMTKNALNYTLDCEKASPDNVGAWLNSVPHADLLDFDIQKGEAAVLPAIIDLLESKAYRIIVGTHSPEIHTQIKRLFEGGAGRTPWIRIWESPHSTPEQQKCVKMYLRRAYSVRWEQTFRWEKMVKGRCYHDTPRGPVAGWDGELIYDNPRFVDRTLAFSPSDTVLKINDLK